MNMSGNHVTVEAMDISVSSCAHIPYLYYTLIFFGKSQHSCNQKYPLYNYIIVTTYHLACYYCDPHECNTSRIYNYLAKQAMITLTLHAV